MKDSATQSKAAEPIVYKSKEELFTRKREQMKKTLSKIDPEQLKAILNRDK